MAFTAITKPAVGDPTRKDTFADQVIDDLDYLYGAAAASGGGRILNGSFESGSAANTAPANWTMTLASGNSTAFETTAANVAHGAQSFKMTTPGSITGGVALEANDFGILGEGQVLNFSWYMKSTVAGILNTVAVNWYDRAGSLISTTTLYTSTANATSWTYYNYAATAPANARFFKLVVTGVNNATAGSVYWDGFECRTGPLYLRTVYTTGSGTHTYQKWTNRIKVTGCGGGGGGGKRTDGATPAGSGGSTTLGSIFTATGGTPGGSNSGATGGAGAGPAAGSYSSGLLKFGSKSGGDGASYTSAAADGVGKGLGGGGRGFGAGGDGANVSSGANCGGTGGGSSGMDAEYTGTVTPGASASYAVGAGGDAGSNASAGVGGVLIIEEFSE